MRDATSQLSWLAYPLYQGLSTHWRLLQIGTTADWNNAQTSLDVLQNSTPGIIMSRQHGNKDWEPTVLKLSRMSTSLSRLMRKPFGCFLLKTTRTSTLSSPNSWRKREKLLSKLVAPKSASTNAWSTSFSIKNAPRKASWTTQRGRSKSVAAMPPPFQSRSLVCSTFPLWPRTPDAPSMTPDHSTAVWSTEIILFQVWRYDIL